MSDFSELEFEIKVLRRSVTKLESDVRENFGLIKELHGKQVTDQRLDSADKVNMQQERAIGQLQMGLDLITKALAESGDKSLKDAASNISDKITINVQGGSGGDNFNNLQSGDGAESRQAQDMRTKDS